MASEFQHNGPTQEPLWATEDEIREQFPAYLAAVPDYRAELRNVFSLLNAAVIEFSFGLLDAAKLFEDQPLTR